MVQTDSEASVQLPHAVLKAAAAAAVTLASVQQTQTTDEEGGH